MKNKEALEALDRIDETLSFMRNMMNESDELVLLNIPSFKADMDGIIKDFRAHGARIRAALTQPEQEWQDISTAPRDGTQIIVNAPQLESESTYAYWEKGWRLAYDGKPFGVHVQQPTHWMPLPNSPIDK